MNKKKRLSFPTAIALLLITMVCSIANVVLFENTNYWLLVIEGIMGLAGIIIIGILLNDWIKTKKQNRK